MSNGHAVLSPSSAERWFACPGSIRISEGAPRQRSSYAAAEGTVAHSLAERLLKRSATTDDLRKEVGSVVVEDGQEVEITDEMVSAATQFFDLVTQDHKHLSSQKGQAPVELRVEQRVKAKLADGSEVWGTADAVLFKKGRALRVYDFKYGKGHVVEVEENPQMSIYGVATMDSEAGWAFDEVELVIVQPRADHADGTVRRWMTGVTALGEFKKQLAAAAAETRKPDAAVIAGAWCRWCPGKGNCPVVTEKVQSLCEVEFSPAVPVRREMPVAAELTVERLALVLEHEDVITSFVEAVRLRVRELLEQGVEVPGWKLVEGRAVRKWADEETVRAEFEPVLGEAIWEPRKLLSPAKLEKLMGKGKVDHLTVKPEVPRSIARESDKRQAARRTAEVDFGPKFEDPFAAVTIMPPAVKPKAAPPAKSTDLAALEAELVGVAGAEPDPFAPPPVVAARRVWP